MGNSLNTFESKGSIPVSRISDKLHSPRFSSIRPVHVSSYCPHPHHSLPHWHVLDPRHCLDPGMCAHLRAVPGQVLHHRCDGAGGSRAWRSPSGCHHLSGLLREGNPARRNDLSGYAGSSEWPRWISGHVTLVSPRDTTNNRVCRGMKVCPLLSRFRKWWRTTTWFATWTPVRRWATPRPSVPTRLARWPWTAWPWCRPTSLGASTRMCPSRTWSLPRFWTCLSWASGSTAPTPPRLWWAVKIGLHSGSDAL